MAFCSRSSFWGRFTQQTSFKGGDSVSPSGGQFCLPSSIINIRAPLGAKIGRFTADCKRLGSLHIRYKGKIAELSEFTMVLLPFSRTTDTASTSHHSQTPASSVNVPLVSSRAELIHPGCPHSLPSPPGMAPTSLTAPALSPPLSGAVIPSGGHPIRIPSPLPCIFALIMLSPLQGSSLPLSTEILSLLVARILSHLPHKSSLYSSCRVLPSFCLELWVPR